jgi:hypothetical protein
MVHFAMEFGLSSCHRSLVCSVAFDGKLNDPETRRARVTSQLMLQTALAQPGVL